MSQTNFLNTTIDHLSNLTSILTKEAQNFLEESTVSTGKTLDWIASNPILKFADKVIGLDWLMSFFGKVDHEQIQATVEKIKVKYPQETSSQIAQRLIIEKAWAAGRLGIITNIIPPVAALLFGIELIATTKLQTEMVYEIAAAYDLDLEEPARRGEALAIFGLSLGADVLKTGFNLVEIIPGIGAVVGASTNAAMLYVLGQTAHRFYEAKTKDIEISSLQQATNNDWQIALNQSRILDRILAYMVQVSYSEQEWKQILPQIKEISPSSVKTIAVNIEQPQNLNELLEQLIPEFAPLALERCYNIAKSNGEITLKEQEVLSQIAIKFNLDLSQLESTQ